MSYEHLTLERAEHVATVTLNRPDKLNAISRALHREMCRSARSYARTTMSAR